MGAASSWPSLRPLLIRGQCFRKPRAQHAPRGCRCMSGAVRDMKRQIAPFVRRSWQRSDAIRGLCTRFRHSQLSSPRTRGPITTVIDCPNKLKPQRDVTSITRGYLFRRSRRAIARLTGTTSGNAETMRPDRRYRENERRCFTLHCERSEAIRNQGLDAGLLPRVGVSQ